LFFIKYSFILTKDHTSHSKWSIKLKFSGFNRNITHHVLNIAFNQEIDGLWLKKS